MPQLNLGNIWVFPNFERILHVVQNIGAKNKQGAIASIWHENMLPT